MSLDIPNFSTQKETIDYLVANKLDLIDCKKSAIKYADSCGLLVSTSDIIVKSADSSKDTDNSIYRTLVGNTYNWLDSHGDVHLNNVFGTSIKERKGRIPHRHDHVNQLTAKVGKFSDVYEQMVNWTDLGINKVGKTMALLADSEIKRNYNQLIFDSYKDNEIDQHSVGMQYVKIYLGVNDPEYKEEFEIWNKYIGLVGNQDKAIDKGYVWFVKEAKLIEISCVTEGSNELTGMYSPSKDSVNIDPPLEQSKKKSIYSHFI